MTVGGDSGAWIIDNETGDVCGHVTAWSEFHQNGTMAPMEVLLHDMEQTLGKPVALPVPDTAIPAQSYKEQITSQLIQQEIEIATFDPFKGKAREASFDSNYGSDTEPDTNADTEPERPGTSCTSTSPMLSTAPSPLSKDVSALSLDDVAEQWRRSQSQNRMAATGGQMEGRGVSKEIRTSVRAADLHGLEARC